MSMSINDQAFFSENITNVNKMVSKILVAMDFVPVLLLVLTKLGLFNVPTEFAAVSISYSVVISTSFNFLIRSHSAFVQKISMYLGVLGIEGFIAMMGTSTNIGVYICYGVVPIICCLYYNRHLSIRICVMSYLLMLASLYVKFTNGAAIFDMLDTQTFQKAYLPVAAGFTIEFMFVFLIVNFLSIRNHTTLKHLISVIDDRNGFVQKLRQSKDEFQKKNSELKETQFKIIQFIAECLGSHDLFTGSHVIHTRTYVELIARRLRENGSYKETLTDETIALYASAAFVHDIGKIHIPEGILNKQGKFTREEFELMKSHPEEGRRLLQVLPKIDDGRFNEIATEMAYCHHEKWDGTGYFRGIAGKQIPLCARIMTAADVLDALISQRLYKNPKSIDQAMRVFLDSRGTHFEPCIADAVISLRDTIEKIDRDYKKKESEAYKKELEWWNNYHNMMNVKR